MIENESAVELGTDEVACILSFLPLTVIMCLRRVNMTWNEAAKETVPSTGIIVKNVTDYNAMRVMTKVLPNLQQITIGCLESGHKWSDGEDPDEEQAAETATTHDIGIISNFRKLRDLKISTGELLNGRYPIIFNFPLLQKLDLTCSRLKWDLEMLVGLPLLKELGCWENHCMTGNVNSLRVLKDTLETVAIVCCEEVEGDLMKMADFPHLKELTLIGTALTGDIRDIGGNDFSSLEQLTLPSCATGHEFQRIFDAPDLMRAVYLLRKQHPALKMEDWGGYHLSRDSPDWYQSMSSKYPPPFYLRFVEAGSRLGYRWENALNHPCEVNWLDPEPESGGIGYEDYVTDYRRIQDEIGLYRGYYEPPNVEQYTLLSLLYERGVSRPM
jgi:hypothetical protein